MVYIILIIIAIMVLPTLLEELGNIVAGIIGIGILIGGIILLVKLIKWIFVSGAISTIGSLLLALLKIVGVFVLVCIVGYTFYSMFAGNKFKKAQNKIRDLINEYYFTKHIIKFDTFRVTIQSMFPSAEYDSIFQEKAGKTVLQYAEEQFRQITLTDRSKQYSETKEAINNVLNFKIKNKAYVTKENLFNSIPNMYVYEEAFANFDKDFKKYCLNYYCGLVDKELLNISKSRGALSSTEFVEIIQNDPIAEYFDNWKKYDIEKYVADVMSRRNDIDKVKLSEYDDTLYVNPNGGSNLIKKEINL